MSTALRALLVRLREENKINKLAGRNERIVRHRTARRCLETACSKLKFPAFTHRAMRHFFATCAIESAVDIPTVSRWLGHKDGGALAMRGLRASAGGTLGRDDRPGQLWCFTGSASIASPGCCASAEQATRTENG